MARWHWQIGPGGVAVLFWSMAARADDTTIVPVEIDERLDQWVLYVLVGLILLAGIVALLIIKASVAQTPWSLTDALSEEATVALFVKDAAGREEPKLTADGQAVTGPVMKASISRLIALMGLIAILMLFLGFGAVVLYYVGRGLGPPPGLDKVTDFLLAGLTLFAPYLVNKFTSIFSSLAGK